MPLLFLFVPLATEDFTLGILGDSALTLVEEVEELVLIEGELSVLTLVGGVKLSLLTLVGVVLSKALVFSGT